MTLKFCFREPIPEIFKAARMLSAAVDAHLRGRHDLASSWLVQANMPAIRDWTESIWGGTRRAPYAPKPSAESLTLKPLAKDARAPKRMPLVAMKRALHERDGYHCRFCGTPVIRAEVRKGLVESYPQLDLWDDTNASQHAALQAMCVNYDHILPHAYGGTNELSNLLVTCSPCNYAKMAYTLEQAGLADPFLRPPVKSSWDGLERLLKPELASAEA